jgi:hypothetical protein
MSKETKVNTTKFPGNNHNSLNNQAFFQSASSGILEIKPNQFSLPRLKCDERSGVQEKKSDFIVMNVDFMVFDLHVHESSK